jgi:hypothetical protein
LAAGTNRGFGPEIWTRYTTDPFPIPVILQAPIVTPEGPNTLNVRWNGVHDSLNRIGGYIIEYRNSENPIWIEHSDVVRHEPGKVQYQGKLTGLTPDTLYFVRIRVVDHKQRVGDASPEAQARTGCSAPISPPSNVNLNLPSPRQVRVHWQPPPKSSWLCSAIRYTVEYRTGNQSPKQVGVPR